MLRGLDFGVLGPLQMTVGGGVVPLGSRKQRAVLAILLVNRNRVVGTDALIEGTWERLARREARASLHSYVSNLRRLLNDAGVDGRTVLAAAPPGYNLAVPDTDCDIGRFAAAKTAGVSAAEAGRFEAAGRYLSAALSEWRGPVLADLQDYEFVVPLAAALAEDRITVHIARAEVEIACGRAGTVIGELERLVIDQPYREPLWCQLITAYHVADRQSDALAAYRRLQTALDRDLGVQPGPTVRALHESVLRQDVLDVRRAALTAASVRAGTIGGRVTAADGGVVAHLRAASGELHQLSGAATRIGRLTDNDVVLDDPEVSRHHAVVSDTGASFVITDLRSANGVHVAGRRIRGSAVLADGDPIRIGSHEFVFEAAPLS